MLENSATKKLPLLFIAILFFMGNFAFVGNTYAHPGELALPLSSINLSQEEISNVAITENDDGSVLIQIDKKDESTVYASQESGKPVIIDGVEYKISEGETRSPIFIITLIIFVIVAIVIIVNIRLRNRI